jgi:signal transduction histidine kinase
MSEQKPLSPNPVAEVSPLLSADVQRMLTGILQISEMVGSVMLLEDILDRIVSITSEMMEAPVSSLYLLDETNQRLVLRSNLGFEPELRNKVGFDIDQGIVGWVARHGEMVHLDDATSDPRYRPLPSTLELGCRAYLCAPLRIQEQIVGVMTLRKREVYRFNQSEILFFVTVCKQVAIVIEKARMYEKRAEAERLAAVALSLTGVAHYIKNVLQTMKGGEYLVEQGLRNEDAAFLREGWEVLKRSNSKIRGLVENILNYVRDSKPNRRQVTLNSMVLDLLGTLARHASERNVALAPELDSNLEEMWVDPDQIYDALLNLIGNAIDAAPNDRTGKVTVRTSQLSGRHQILVEIVDNGTGIPPEIQSKIFNLFFTTKGQKGTGIGLSATKKIVEDHGGTIELESTPGQGTRFRVFLPTTPPPSVA